MLMNALISNAMALALTALPTNGSHTETTAFADVAQIVNAEVDRGARVIYVTDLDNTILATDRDIGSEHWFLWQKQLIEAGDVNAVARNIDELLVTQGLILAVGRMHPTEATIPETVAAFAARGVETMVLTSRNLDVRDITHRELTRNGFDFGTAAPGPLDGYAATWLPFAGGKAVSYERGIMLTQGQNKGEMLKALLAKTDESYDAIVFVDDRPHHLENMRRAFEGRPEAVHTVLFTNERPEIDAFHAGDKAEEIAAWCAFSAAWTELSYPDTPRAELPYLACQ